MEPIIGFGIFLIFMAFVTSLIGFLDYLNVISFGPNANWFFTNFYANLATEFLSIGGTILFIDKLNNNRAEKQIKLQLQKQKTLDLYDEYETPGMVNVRMKIHLLLAKNNELDQPIAFYEMYQNMCLHSPDSVNPETNESNIDTWANISTLILYFGKLGNYRRQDMLDKELFIKFLGDFEYYYVRCLYKFLQISIIDSTKRGQTSRVDLLKSIVELAEWAEIDIENSRFFVQRDSDLVFENINKTYS